MPEVRMSTMVQGYVPLVMAVLLNGDKVAPRGQATRELLGTTIVLDDPYTALPIGVGRKLNIGIAAAEAVQLIGGFSDPQLMSAVSKNFDQFRDGGIFHGAYGPRIRPQLEAVVRRLDEDSSTRQAVITLWDPLHDLHVAGQRDYPCTVALHFMIRSGKLDLHVTMRSNDVWWGLTYDVFQFTQLQLTVASALRRGVGTYYHHANSLHLYERDIPAVEHLHDYDFAPLPMPHGINGGTSMAENMERARMIGEGVLPKHSSPSELWFFETLCRFTDAS